MSELLQENITRLESDVTAIRETMEKFGKKLDSIYIGLYGDEDNDILGLIKERKLTNKRIETIEQEIRDIKKVNEDQDLALKVKGNLTEKLIKWAGIIAFGYLVLKDVIGIDSIFEILIRK